MPRYKITIEYDGTGLAGWQRQNDVPSVQQYLEEAIEPFAGTFVRVNAAGRTDAGVHAFGQIAHFDMAKQLPTDNVMKAINFYLATPNISVVDVEEVSSEFHARFSAQKRYYVYRMINRRAPLALELNRAWFVPGRLNIDKMRQAATYLVGQHDFTSLRDSQCQAQSPIKTLDEVRVEQNGDIIEIHVSAKSFLHHMVRNIAGTLKFVGDGRWQPEHIPQMLAACDRAAGGPTAPPHGLYFVKVDY